MKNKIYSKSCVAVDKNGQEHVVTIVGLFEQKKERTHEVVRTELIDEKGKASNCELIVEKSSIKRVLSLGWSICHPSDENIDIVGVAIAKSRAKRHPIGKVESYNVTMLNDDACEALVDNELKHYVAKIDKYIA